MLPNLADQRAEREAALKHAAEQRAAGWRRARLGFKLLAAPVVLGVCYVIWLCGYWSGWLDALAK